MDKLLETYTNRATQVLQQGRRCRDNVTLRSFHITIVAMEKQQVLHILSVCL
jgi:hypothetical protein